MHVSRCGFDARRSHKRPITAVLPALSSVTPKKAGFAVTINCKLLGIVYRPRSLGTNDTGQNGFYPINVKSSGTEIAGKQDRRSPTPYPIMQVMEFS